MNISRLIIPDPEYYVGFLHVASSLSRFALLGGTFLGPSLILVSGVGRAHAVRG